MQTLLRIQLPEIFCRQNISQHRYTKQDKINTWWCYSCGIVMAAKACQLLKGKHMLIHTNQSPSSSIQTCMTHSALERGIHAPSNPPFQNVCSVFIHVRQCKRQWSRGEACGHRAKHISFMVTSMHIFSQQLHTEALTASYTTLGTRCSQVVSLSCTQNSIKHQISFNNV